jgi:hypothetical protein
MKKLHEKLVEAEKDGYEVYEVTYLEHRMTEKHWDEVQKSLDVMAKAALKKK